jgi:DNA (cytosine-5)-methyltransferase 1
MKEPIFLIVDLFCGAGGTTTGFAMASDNVAKVIACVNHDAKAIESHWQNHPEVKHFEEDIRTLDLSELVDVVKFQRSLYPEAKLILWASLECTNFSKAKGGLPRDADSRTLADHLHRYVTAINPDYVQIENVVEFMSWGPLIAKVSKTEEGYPCCAFSWVEVEEVQYANDGFPQMTCDTDINGDAFNVRFRTTKLWKPIYHGVPESRKNGQDWMRWRNEMCAHGYYDDWKELNSADYGAYTSRNRLFGCFARPELPIVFPTPTYAKKPSVNGMYGDFQKWKAVKDVLDFTDEGESIFTRRKPLSDKTLERIYAGLVKYVAKGDTAFLTKYFSGRPAGKVSSVDNPSSTVTTFGGQTLVQADTCDNSDFWRVYKHLEHSANEEAAFLAQRNNGNPNSKIVDVNGPARTLTATGGNQDLVQPEFLTHYYSGGGQHSDVNSPCPVVTAMDGKALVQPQFIANYNHSSKTNDVNEVAPTLLTRDKLALTTPEYFIDKHFGSAQNQSIDQPAGAILPTDKHRLVEVHHFLMNPCWRHQVHSTETVAPTIIAKQDKAPLYFVQVEAGNVSIAIYEGEPEIMIKIKQFMAVYGLVDIKMRMLRVHELLRIQGFPEGYKLAGNQSDQKKFIGNSVVPHVVKAWAECMAKRIVDNEEKKVA